MREKTSFSDVLVSNEFKALKGKYNSTVWYLFVIMFIAFFAFGFAKSTLSYQKQLSADPYSNWINLNYHAGTRDSLISLDEKIRHKQFCEIFHIKGSYFYNKGMVSVLVFSSVGSTVQYEARTIDPASGIVKDLLRAGVCAKYFPDSIEQVFLYEPNGVIISRKLLEDIGLDKRSMSFIQMKSPEGDLVPVPVLAVVDELPDLSDIVYTNLFYCKTMNTGFYDRENNYYRMFIENMDTAGVLTVLKELIPALEIQEPSTVQTTVLKTGNRSVLNWKIEIGKQVKDIPVSVINGKIGKLGSLKNHHSGQYFELSKDTTCDNSAFFHDYLAIEFNDMEKIRDFSKFLKEKLNLQLNLEVLSDRENYLYTGNIALGSIILLMILSILSVSIYISGIIRHHLVRIRRNLGNFLAFGVKNSTLIRLYVWVTIKILATAFIPAFLLACLTGELFEKYLLGKLLMIDTAQNYFSLMNSWFAIFLVLILSVAVLRTFISVRNTLKHSPGNLVYERDS
jgi:hypothetical protein